MSTAETILANLRSLSNPENVAGMARYGISSHNTLGVSMPALRGMAKELGKNHVLAGELWDSGIHEARILASLVDVPSQVSEAQMEDWAADFDSWDVCDQVCSNLFDRTPYAWAKALDWSGRSEEFVKRAGFVLMAALASHAKKAPDEQFEFFFPIIARQASDERNFVRKAVNWALRGIGKRSRALNARAIEVSYQILENGPRAARWVASDALRELTSEKIQARLL
jgi:3-methyladenine DNA glycosylase AlkD